MTQIKIILFVAAVLTALHNFAFFGNVIDTYAGAENLLFRVSSLAVLLFCVLTALLALLPPGKALKPMLILVLLVSSFTAYFMDIYNVVINSDMIDNVAQTNIKEAGDLLSLRLAAYVTLLGLLPSYIVYRMGRDAAPQGFFRALAGRLGLITVSLLLAAGTLFLSSDFYASFFREHKPLRYYTNPITPVYSLVKFTRSRVVGPPKELRAIGTDATNWAGDDHRELVILVVGETARADHFSMNGYGRDTNPLLRKDGVISFTHVSSCGTSTAISVPCMFSLQGHDGYDQEEAAATENLLDVLKRAKVSVLWRDNNSSSKGVADRVTYEDFSTPEKNPLCDPECRDEGMLDGLSEWIDRQGDRDILIVLHQMGSHGPAYYKRYPAAFEKFTPVCQTNQLDQCSDEEIKNAYDNSILYTDYFLSKVIELLKQKSDTFETAMLYFSDHGESLGESGIYLHGMPYLFAPAAQTQVPGVLWLGPRFDELDVAGIRAERGRQFSHDNIFHTVLGLIEIQTEVYDPHKDILVYTDAEPWRKSQANMQVSQEKP